jgi:hypothetical protein
MIAYQLAVYRDHQIRCDSVAKQGGQGSVRGDEKSSVPDLPELGNLGLQGRAGAGNEGSLYRLHSDRGSLHGRQVGKGVHVPFLSELGLNRVVIRHHTDQFPYRLNQLGVVPPTGLDARTQRHRFQIPVYCRQIVGEKKALDSLRRFSGQEPNTRIEKNRPHVDPLQHGANEGGLFFHHYDSRAVGAVDERTNLIPPAESQKHQVTRPPVAVEESQALGLRIHRGMRLHRPSRAPVDGHRQPAAAFHYAHCRAGIGPGYQASELGMVCRQGQEVSFDYRGRAHRSALMSRLRSWRKSLWFSSSSLVLANPASRPRRRRILRVSVSSAALQR